MPKDTQFNPYWKNLINFFFDKDTDWKPKFAVALSLGYLLWPLDLIPDFVPILGWLDDIGITALAIAYLGYAVKKYLHKTTDAKAEPTIKAISHQSILDKHRNADEDENTPSSVEEIFEEQGGIENDEETK